MEGDNDNYYCDLGTCAGGAGGTSFAAPRWAAFMALVNQQAQEVGSAPSGGLGFINPSIYSIGEGSNYGADFHDVTDGNNDTANQIVWYNAVTGYDLVTGWGSPNGQNLIDALAGTIVPGFWLTTAPSTLSVYQGDSGTSVVSVTDAGGFAGSVSLTASNLPTGVTASFNPTSTPGTSDLILTADSTATVGTQTVSVSGTSGALTATNQLFLTVNPPQTPPPPGGQFGPVNIGATSNATPLILTITTAGTLSNIGILTQGSPNLDFADAGGDTCSIGTAYAVNATCTVNVKFGPKYPGTRYGAVVLTDANGIRLAEAYLRGSGTGPQTTFNPGSETTIGTGFLSPEGVAITGDGSVYVADYGNSTTHGAVYLETLSNGGYTQTQPSCTYDTPASVAVDGSGTLYVADPGASAVYKVTISNGSCTQTTIGSGFYQPWGVAVDGSGNVYIAVKGNGAVYKEALQSNGSYVQSSVGSGWIKPVGVAVDGAGNIYVADSGIPGVFMETPSEGNYTQTLIGQGWTAPSGIAVDSTGNIDVSEAGNSIYDGGSVPAGVYKEVLANGSYIQTPIGAAWTAPYGLAVDSTGNVEVADVLRGIYKEDFADPPQLTFANAATGTTSSDSPRIVTVSNLGTAPLNFSAVSYPTDYSEAGTGSSDCTPTTSLQAGQTCTLTIEFLPTTSLGGNTSLLLNEAVSISTNTLNTTATQQSIPVSGTEVLPGGSVYLDVSANPSTAGNSITFTATVSGSSGGPTPTGTVTFYNGTTPLGPAESLNNGVAQYSTASLAAGVYAISAAYSGDSNYAGSTSNTINESVLAAAGTAPISSTNLGTQNVGSISSPIPLTITFAQAETLGSIAVLTGGAANFDFTNSGGGTCTIGNEYTANANCTVNVTFSPKYPGARFGAVVLSDNHGNVIGTGYLEGTGIGAQTSFLPGTLASIPFSQNPNVAYPQGIAVDNTGALYVADVANAAVYKETVNYYGYYVLAAIGSGFTQPYGVAVDAAGNVYVADSGNDAVYKLTPTNGSYTQAVVGYGFTAPMGVAVDGLGNIYIADYGNGVNPGAVYVETFSNGSYTQTQITGTFNTPQGVAVDGNGDIFVADSANGSNAAAVYELTPSNGSYNQSSIGYGWVTPTGVAVDGNGNVFITDDAYDTGDGFVVEETPEAGGTYTQTVIVSAGTVPGPGGIAVDDRGNRYISDNFGATEYLQDVADPSASFAATDYGQTSSDSPKTITVQNVGNATLTFSSVSYPTDFPEVPAVPTDCTATSSLQIGSSCTLTINFTPSAPLGSNQSQSLAEGVSITTNSLGGSTQNVAVSGTEAAPAASVALAAPSNVFVAGANVTFTATVTGQNGLPTPTGTVTFNATTYGGTTTLGTTPLTNGVATYSTSSLTAAVYSITAAYSGDQVYPTSTSPAFVENIIPSSTFGTESIGNSEFTAITVTFSSHTTLGSITVLTEGMPNLDFTNAGTGTCKIGNRYSSKSSCTVAISFKPTFAGARHGALLIGDNTGKLLQTIYLDGNGVGPQVSFQPATETTLIPETSAPCAQAVDANGDIYVNTCSAIMKYTLNNGTYTSSQVPSSALGDIAVDGAGNVYIAGGGEVLKETLFQGTYSESVLATGLNAPRDIAVDGKGVVYFIVGYGAQWPPSYPQLYEDTPSSTGGYSQTSTSLQNVYNPIKLAVDDSGDIFLNDHQLWQDVTGPPYFIEILDEYPLGIYEFDPNYLIWGKNNEVVKLAFVDPRGNLYVTVDNQFVEMPPITGAPPYLPMPTDAWGMDGSGNLYRNVDNAITKVNLASPPNLRFAQTNVGSTSSDSPKVATLENIGNAPLTFSVPGSGTNPSVSTNFSLDSSGTCPQISVSGASSSLNMEGSCTYEVNFTPTTTGTIDGSAVVSDNALNAAGGTQTIPLSGSGTSGGGPMIAMLTGGPGGVPHIVMVPNESSLGTQNYGSVWVDTVHRTLVLGLVFLETDSNGNLTCNSYPQNNVVAKPGPLLGTLNVTTDNLYLPGGLCPGKLFAFQDVHYTWGSKTAADRDPFVLRFTTQNGTYENDFAVTARFANITVSPAVQSGSGSNPPLTATASLMNSPPGANGFDWTIIGANGTIVFPNGKEKMSSSSNSITIEDPNPTISPVAFTLKVDIYGGALDYGPREDSFPNQFTVQYASYIPVDHVSGPTPCPYVLDSNGLPYIPMIYIGDANRGTYKTEEQLVMDISAQQSYNFFPDTGHTRNYDAINSPVNGATLSQADEDGIQYDCHLWNDAGQADSSGFEHDETYPLNSQGQVHFTGSAGNPLEPVDPPITWDMRTVINIQSDGATAYVNYNHTCYPAHQVKVNGQIIYSYIPPRNDLIYITGCLSQLNPKIVGQSSPVSIPVQ